MRPRLALWLVLAIVAGCSRHADQPADATAGAATADKQALAESEIAFGRELAALTSAADDHQERRYFDQAIRARQETLDLVQAHYGAGAWQTRSARVALKRSRQLAGLDPAQRQLLDAAADAERRAADLWKRGRRPEALLSIVQARSFTTQLWGAEDHSVANLIHQEAVWRGSLGDAAAETLFGQAIALRAKIFSVDHPDTIASTNALGLFLQTIGRRAEAEAPLRDAAAAAKAVWGDQHAEYALHLNNLGMLYYDMGDHARAGEFLRQALDIRRAALGEKHPLVAHSLFNLGSTYHAAGDSAQAAPLFRQALTIFESSLGAGHRMARLAGANLGIALGTLRDFPAAEAVLREDMEITRRELGENRAEFAECLTRLAILYGNQGRYAEAQPLADQAVAIHRAASGADHPATRKTEEIAASVRERLNSRAGSASTATRIPAVPPESGARPASFEGSKR
ncbi:MAG: tetratricopeptide repeat protein [Planctomycetia bacterium]|nr:tetratricopeptide repeat protein [Planctomycetia bacterium]